MGVLSSLKSLIGDQGFTPSASTFPEIDTAGINRELSLQKIARERGSKNLPPKDQKNPDSVELAILARMSFLRNQGLEFYENMLSAYQARINRADSISQTIRAAALQARGNFRASATNSRAEMEYSLMGVVDALDYLTTFRREHKLNRPYLEERRKSIYTLIIVVIVMLFVEVAINAFFFAETSPQGILGGAFFALIFALANVTVSGFAGWFIRFKNHRNLLLKTFGVLMIVAFLAVAVTLNIGIGLYRDALEATGDATAASAVWFQNIQQGNILLQSIKSVILALMGLMISLITVVKTYASFDPYPGYDSVARRVENALSDYAAHLYETISELEEQRDEFTQEFEASSRAADLFLSEAADALHGHAALRNKLIGFFDELSGATNLLVQQYRDKNIESRTDNQVPDAFKESPNLKTPLPEKLKTDNLESKADVQRKEIRKIASETIDDISRVYEAYVSYFPSVEQLRQGWRAGDLPSWETVVSKFDVGDPTESKIGPIEK